MPDWVDAAGNGSIAYRLEIEGWPCEFVTDPRITHATFADGRQIVGGLSWNELIIRDRVVMQESTLQSEGVEFRIVPDYLLYTAGSAVETDWPTYFLSREVDPTDVLNAAMTYDATTLVRHSGEVFSSGIVIHVGTEAMRTGSSGAVTRHIWGTQPQAHPVVSFDRTELPKIYLDIPPTMEGRRAYLYAYGDAHDPAGNGSIVWRGMVAAVPKRDDDGIAWIIDCDSINAVLNQNVAGSILEAHPIGIYHHAQASFVVWVGYDDDWSGPFYYTKHDLNEAEMLVGISTMLTGAVADAGADAIIESIALEKTADGLRITIRRNSATGVEFQMLGGSAILGFVSTTIDGWGEPQTSLTSTEIIVHNTISGGALLPSSNYSVHLQRNAGGISTAPFAYGGAPVSPLGPASGIITSSLVNHTLFNNPSLVAQAAFPPFRIYVDTDMTGVESVFIPDTNKADQFYQVIGTGSDEFKYYIDLDGSFQLLPFLCGFLGNETNISALRRYAVGALADFVAGLKFRGRDFGNAGDTPFITDADLNDFTPLAPVQGVALLRVYSFIKQRRVNDITKEECKLINHFMRIELDGRIGIAPIPAWTEATPVDDLHTIGLGDILTPPDGFWPKWTPNRDGRVTTVTIQHDYSPRDDDWLDDPAVFTAFAAVPVAKGRGKAEATIKPFSTPVFRVPSQDPGAREMLSKIAEPLLAYFAGNYAIVTVAVPYTKFDILCGDIVSITHPLIPAGDGTKGVVDRHGVVIERRWNLDPSRSGRGELTILLTGRGVVGYAPSAYITDKTNTSGNTWVLEVSSADPLNQALSTYANGEPTNVDRHFAVGDFVRVQRFDHYAVEQVLGVVTAVAHSPAEQETVTVLFAGTWTPGDPELIGWVLEYQVDTGSTATESQRRYAYVADSVSQQLPDGTFGRKFN